MPKIILNGVDYYKNTISGGDSVEWSQIETSGTKIAEITINGDMTEVYAPSGSGSSGHNYSTQEQVVGTWIDGKPLYEITLDFGSISANSAKTIDVSSLNIDYVTSFNTTALLNNGTLVPIPISHTVNMGSQHFCRYNTSGSFGIYTGSGQAITQAYMTVRYIKTTD